MLRSKHIHEFRTFGLYTLQVCGSVILGLEIRQNQASKNPGWQVSISRREKHQPMRIGSHFKIKTDLALETDNTKKDVKHTDAFKILQRIEEYLAVN